MQILNEITIPKETVNDDSVKIIKWNFQNEQIIKKGDILVEIETSKALLDIESQYEGKLEIIKFANEEVLVGDIIGRIVSLDYVFSEKNNNLEIIKDIKTSNISELETTTMSISNKAKTLILQNGIDINIFSDRKFVKESDVLEYLKKISIKNSNIVFANTTKEIEFNDKKNDIKKIKKSLFQEARNASESRGKSIIWLVVNYIFMNWLLTLFLKIAPYGINIWLHRLRGVKIGDGCFIDPSAIIETAHPSNITIGNDVRIAAHSIIMCHIKAPVLLRELGYIPFLIKPVILKDSCFIGVNAILMPGVVIGKGAVVSSGAVVLTNVPDFSLVSGNPAKVVKYFTKELDE